MAHFGNTVLTNQPSHLVGISLPTRRKVILLLVSIRPLHLKHVHIPLCSVILKYTVASFQPIRQNRVSIIIMILAQALGKQGYLGARVGILPG